MDKSLTLDDFYFDLPQNLIAQAPISERSSAKLLIRQKNGEIVHSVVKNLLDAFDQPCLFIANDSKVIPARIFGTTPTGAKIEFLLLKHDLSKDTWDTMAKPKKRLRDNQIIQFPDNLSAIIVSVTGASPQSCLLKFDCSPQELFAWLDKFGQMPVPPYIKRSDDHADTCDLLKKDKERYQTVFAEAPGSVAAPTASLHFDHKLLSQMRARSFDFATVTLHVGAGTFFPVTSQDLKAHRMHHEVFSVSCETLNKIESARSQSMPIVAVGTTTLRTLESFFHLGKDIGDLTALTNQWHETDLFIYPQTDADSYRPYCIDALMTNFHQPGSTLFLLICALIGRSQALQMYKTACQNHYRFLSYGDSSLLWLT